MHNSKANYHFELNKGMAKLTEREKRHACVTLLQSAVLCYERASFLATYMGDEEYEFNTEVLEQAPESKVMKLFGKKKVELPEFLEFEYLVLDQENRTGRQHQIRTELSHASFCLGLAKHLYAATSHAGAQLQGRINAARSQGKRNIWYEMDFMPPHQMAEDIEMMAVEVRPLLEPVEKALHVKANDAGRDLFLDGFKTIDIETTMREAAKCGDEIPLSRIERQREGFLGGSCLSPIGPLLELVEETEPKRVQASKQSILERV